MKLTENTVTAISAVLLIAATCAVLYFGGLNMSPGSDTHHGAVDITASTHD